MNFGLGLTAEQFEDGIQSTFTLLLIQVLPQAAVLKENMNIDLRVIGITGSSTMLLSDTYVTESSLFLCCALFCKQISLIVFHQNSINCLCLSISPLSWLIKSGMYHEFLCWSFFAQFLWLSMAPCAWHVWLPIRLPIAPSLCCLNND